MKECQAKVVVLLGPPGAGKGTQAKKLIQELGIPQVSTGDLFRKAMSEKTDLGMEAKRFIDQGRLVPDEVTFGMLNQRVSQADCQKGFILDGFPRTQAQAEGLTQLLKKINVQTIVLGLEVENDVLIDRLSGRRTCEKCGFIHHIQFNPPKKDGVCDQCGGNLIVRPDDQRGVIAKRLQVYEESTKPLIDYYRKLGNYKGVNGDRSEAKVFEDLLALISS